MIGIIIADASAPYQKNFMEGVLSELLKRNIDVSVFTPLSKKGMAPDYLAGENTLYSIINYDMLDAIIILPDTIPMDCGHMDEFLGNIYNSYKKPVVCVDYYDDRFVTEITCDIKGMKLVTDHLIDVHGFRNLYYISGPAEHHHSQMRIEGYKMSLENHGIKFDEKNVFYGDFWYETGEKAISEIFKLDIFPEAVVCANEPMALGIIRAFEKRGYKIPDDIAVIGFDADGDGIYNKGILTSGVRDVYSTGVRAARKVLNIMGKCDFKEDDNDNTSVVISQTCGCSHSILRMDGYTPKGAEDMSGSDNIESDFNFMQENMISLCNINDYMWTADWYTVILKEFDRISICINENLINGECNEDNKMMEYTDHMLYIYDNNKVNGKRSVRLDRFFDKSIMYPPIKTKRDKPSVFYFSPFHFYERCFGYVVIQYTDRAVVYNKSYNKWMRYMDTSFESLRRQLNYKIMNDNVTKLYEKNSELSDDMIKTQEQLILSFAEITESKSGQTGKHVKRVSEYSKVLGEALGLSKDETEILRMASMMHDIGKLNIPPEILEKPGKLTSEEFDVIKTHVTEGEKLLHNYPGKVMSQAKTIALEHHEKWNGKGYLGKKGGNIDFASRIVAVADVYDALVSKRSYKEAMDEKRAYDIIVGDSGEHFDPYVVEAFVNNYDKIIEVLRKHPD